MDIIGTKYSIDYAFFFWNEGFITAGLKETIISKENFPLLTVRLHLRDMLIEHAWLFTRL